MAGGHGRDDGHGHTHGVSAGSDNRLLTAALALILVFMAGEVVIGVLAHSIALISDAAHMLTDVFGLAMALSAILLARRSGPVAAGRW